MFFTCVFKTLFPCTDSRVNDCFVRVIFNCNYLLNDSSNVLFVINFVVFDCRKCDWVGVFLDVSINKNCFGRFGVLSPGRVYVPMLGKNSGTLAPDTNICKWTRVRVRQNKSAPPKKKDETTTIEVKVIVQFVVWF